jgi:hypothetical protein
LLLRRLVLGRNGEKTRAEHGAGSEKAVVADADGGEVATDGHVFFHDALFGRGKERGKGRGRALGARMSTGTKEGGNGEG